jgi:hypothetical protein
LLPDDRFRDVSIATSGVAGALLGLSLATLAILLTIPDHQSATTLRRYTAWPALQYTLLATAGDLLVLTVVALTAIAANSWMIRDILLAFGLGSLFGLLVSGAMFALIVIGLSHLEASP